MVSLIGLGPHIEFWDNKHTWNLFSFSRRQDQAAQVVAGVFHQRESACVTFAIFPLAKEGHIADPRFNEQRNRLLLIGKKDKNHISKQNNNKLKAITSTI